MSSARTAPRTASFNKLTPSNPHQSNGSGNSYDANDPSISANFSSNNKSEFDSIPSRSSLSKNVSQYDGVYRNARFIHAISSSLMGQQVAIQTSDRERFHGVLETISPNGDVILSVSHRIDSNNNDIIAVAGSSVDIIDTIDSTTPAFELHKRIIKGSIIVEIVAADIDLSGNGKCLLEETPKVTQLGDERFSRMQHFYDSDEVDPGTLEDLEAGSDGRTGFDVEHMFQTNKEKFQTTTDYDESKYTNVPVPELSEAKRAEIERKVMEIESQKRNDDVDEDDAGVKRPTEYHHGEANSQSKSNRSYRQDHTNEQEYTTVNNRRGNQRMGSNTNNRRGGPSSNGNNPKVNQYNSSRSNESGNYNRSNQYHARGNRGARFTENRPNYETRKSPPQSNNDETHRQQRADSANYSQGPISGPTSPSNIVSARTIYPTNSRSSLNRGSPAPYTGSSSGCNNSNPTISPSGSNQPSNNKQTKKLSRTEHQNMNDESDLNKQSRASNNAPNPNSNINRQSQFHSKQQSSGSVHNVSGQEETLGTYDSNNLTQTDSNASYTASTGATTPNSLKQNAFLNPEADEFVPGFPRENSSRPESRGAAVTSPMAMHPYINHAPAQAALHLIQQQQAQSGQTAAGTTTMIPPTHTPNPTAYYPQYIQTSFPNMPPFINTAQQISLGMVPASMLQAQTLGNNQGNTPNTNNGSSSGMTTPNSSVSGGPTYKVTSNPSQSADTTNAVTNNVTTKKATVSVQNSEQSNTQQPTAVQSGTVPPQILYTTAHPIRYYSPEYMASQAAGQPMPIPIYYQMNSAGMIPNHGVGHGPNIMIPAATSVAGGPNATPSQVYYAGAYDPRMYSLYSTAAGAGVGQHWQMARSPPQQQQQHSQQGQQQQQVSNEQHRKYNVGQNTSVQQMNTASVPAGNSNNSRASSVTGSANNGTNPTPMPSQQYAINGAVPAFYAYGAAGPWLSGHQQIASPQNNMSPQMNAPYNIIFDPSQQPITASQGGYVHPNVHDTQAFYMQTSQPQQSSTQQNLDPNSQQNSYAR